MLPHDPAVLLAASGVLIAVGLVACWLPAWRAARLAPTPSRWRKRREADAFARPTRPAGCYTRGDVMTASGRLAVSLGLLLLVSLTVRGQGLPAPLASPPPGPVQPIPYSHNQHLAQGLVCGDCHVNPDQGALMTLPPTDTCMSCHKTSAAGQPSIQKLALFASSNTPIPWVRVYRLPEYVYWSHATHIQAGITCADCHGPVAERDVITQETNVASKPGCLSCHETRQVFTDCGACHEPMQ